MESSRQEYWSGLPCPSPGDLPDPGVEPVSPKASALQADSVLLSYLLNHKEIQAFFRLYSGDKIQISLFKVEKSETWVAQSCPTLCNPVDYRLPGSSIHVIFQARILEWVAISFSRGSSWPRDQTQISHIVGRPFTAWATREVNSVSSTYNYVTQKATYPCIQTVYRPHTSSTSSLHTARGTGNI